MLRNITDIYSGDKCFPRKEKWHWMWRSLIYVWTNTNIKQEHSSESSSALNVRIIQKMWYAQQGKEFRLKKGHFHQNTRILYVFLRKWPSWHRPEKAVLDWKPSFWYETGLNKLKQEYSRLALNWNLTSSSFQNLKMLKYLQLRLLEFARSGSLFYKITKLIKIWNSKLEKLVSAKFQIYQENFKNDNPRFQFVSKSDSVLLSWLKFCFIINQE